MCKWIQWARSPSSGFLYFKNYANYHDIFVREMKLHKCLYRKTYAVYNSLRESLQVIGIFHHACRDLDCLKRTFGHREAAQKYKVTSTMKIIDEIYLTQCLLLSLNR